MKLSEIRKEAREALSGKWNKAACIALAYMAISFAVAFIQESVGEDSALYDIIDLAYLIINIPLSFGLLISFIKLKRDEDVKYFDFLKEGFYRFSKSWGIAWHTFLKLLSHLILGVFICIIIPLILSFMAFTTNTDPSSAAGLGMSGLIVIVFAIPLLIIWLCPKYLLYVFAYNISYDNPELSSKECVLESAKLMKGNRVKYFLLELSFIGWAILAGFTYGIGLLWLIPYIQVATICFYEKVAKVEVKNAEPAEKIEE